MQPQRQFHGIIIWTVSLCVTVGFACESSSLADTTASGSHRSGNSEPTAIGGRKLAPASAPDVRRDEHGQDGAAGAVDGYAARGVCPLADGIGLRAWNENVTVQGADLYRMNCRGCHGEDGHGAPPEINSVINPVRATSAAAMMERMKTAGMEMSRADADEAGAAIEGYAARPAASWRTGHAGVSASERSRSEFAGRLPAAVGGVRGAEGEQVAVREARVRVGEHIVKSTCHICHSAAGPNPNPQQLYEGAIPPLNTLVLRTSRAEFIRKVTHGAPIMMGAPPRVVPGRMPVFYYLSEEEAADAYLYLTRYPPYPSGRLWIRRSGCGDCGAGSKRA